MNQEKNQAKTQQGSDQNAAHGGASKNLSDTAGQRSQNLLAYIREAYADFTGAEKQVADYTLQHPEDVQYMSISELALAAEVADATISRFCRKLGLSGFYAYKLGLAKSMARPDEPETDASDQLEKAGKPSPEPMDLPRMAKARYLTNLEALQQTYEICPYPDMEEAIRILSKARRVYCMGQGGSLVLAEEAYSLFLTISDKFSVVADSHLQAMTAKLLDEEDAVLYFSYSGSTCDLMDVATICGENHTPLILITRYPRSPGACRASCILPLGSRENPLKSGSVPARIAQLLVIDFLYQGYMLSQGAEALERQSLTSEALNNKYL